MVVETTSSVWKADVLTVVRLLHKRYATVAPIHTVDSVVYNLQNTIVVFFHDHLNALIRLGVFFHRMVTPMRLERIISGLKGQRLNQFD